ncbi:acetylornithine aminotransferase [Ceraceosorus bombacis]|uniref:Acetylornithine aminotransferase n=1 Tax=Ceraceosorus bombacis TaxID=401625 RepID=A0A0P1BRN1_9BASI|nr:acetylornithine aminotransferase [Ceraceosorus bombacis]
MSLPLQPSADAQFGTRHIAKGVGRLTNHVLKRGQGSWIFTDQNVKLLDFTTGIGVVGLGHCHPKVTAAAQEQLGNLVHAQINIGHSEAYIALLRALLPKLALAHPSLDSVFLWNSGAEAVEAAIKLARGCTGKQNVVVMQGSYHGRTLQTAGMTKSKTVYSATFHPVPPGIYATAFPYYAQHGLPPSTPESTLVSASLHQLNLVLSQQTSPRDTAAIILEPVLGEGGYVPAPASFLQGLRKICDQHDILLICDEVQSGIGRTGKWWSCQYANVRPDILIFAKGIANGLPLSGIASRKELTDKQAPGSMSALRSYLNSCTTYERPRLDH